MLCLLLLLHIIYNNTVKSKWLLEIDKIKVLMGQAVKISDNLITDLDKLVS